MTEVKQYLSIVVDAGTWSDPNNVLGSEDNVCASKTTTGGGSAILVAQPICSIPSNAIIDYVYVDGKGLHNHGLYAGGELVLYVSTDDFSWAISSWLGVSSGSCAQTYYKGETEILALWRAMGYDITPDDLNGVGSHFLRFGWQHAAGLAGIYTSYADAGYVRVIYHLPPPAVGYRRGDGLVWIRKTAFFKQRGNHFRYRDRKRGREREYTLVGVCPSRTRRFCGCRRVSIGSARLRPWKIVCGH